MEIKKIEDMAKIVSKYNLSEIEFSQGETKIVVKKERTAEPLVQNSHDNADIMPFENKTENKKNELTTSAKTINSPMVGVFYNAQSPESKPFVVIGDSFKKGDVLCVIEAMKVMNEILAENDGTIKNIFIESGDVVEFAQPIFELE